MNGLEYRIIEALLEAEITKEIAELDEERCAVSRVVAKVVLELLEKAYDAGHGGCGADFGCGRYEEYRSFEEFKKAIL